MNMKRYVKTFLFHGLNAVFNHRPFQHHAVILMYHSIGENGVFFTVHPKEFERQMDYLARYNYSVIALSELAEKLQAEEKLLPKTVVLTFDDGYQDNYENAFPVLQKYGFPATVFVATDFIGIQMNNSYNEPLPMLEEGHIKEMHASGLISIEPHTASHKKLTDRSYEEVLLEIRKSTEELYQILGKKCTTFAYPHGSYNQPIQDVVESQGFLCAVGTREHIISGGEDLFALPRNSVDSSLSFEGFKAKLTKSIVAYHTLKSFHGSLL